MAKAWVGCLGLVLGLGVGCAGSDGGDGAPDDDSANNPDGAGGPAAFVAARQALLAASDDYDFASPPATDSDDCDVMLSASGSDDADGIIEAVEAADSYSTICLTPGTYAMNRSVVVSSASNLTIKGVGDGPEATVLDFAGHSGDKGFDVTTPGFWIENLHIKNTLGNGVEVKAENEPGNPVVFRKLKVTWDLPESGAVQDCSESDPRPMNGAYSVYPTLSSYVVVEFCEVVGASDAGLYVGSVVHGLVRHNQVHGNVAGVEVENSEDVLVYDNEAFDNAGGILALQEPGLKRLSNSQILIRDNVVHDNNACNFARPNTTVANIPSGTGLMSFAGNHIEFRNNDVYGNQTTGVLILSNVLQDLLGGDAPDYPAGYDPFPHEIYVNDNVFSDNATAPAAGPAGDLAMLTGGFADVVWDGFLSPGVADAVDVQLCLGEEPPGFLNITGGQCGEAETELDFLQCVLAGTSTETFAHACAGTVAADGV